MVVAIFNKGIRITPATRQDTTTGEIVNLMSCDAIKVRFLTFDFVVLALESCRIHDLMI